LWSGDREHGGSISGMNAWVVGKRRGGTKEEGNGDLIHVCEGAVYVLTHEFRGWRSGEEVSGEEGSSI